MGDSEGFRRFVNPLLLNLQKMELELTCAIWLLKRDAGFWCVVCMKIKSPKLYSFHGATSSSLSFVDGICRGFKIRIWRYGSESRFFVDCMEISALGLGLLFSEIAQNADVIAIACIATSVTNACDCAICKAPFREQELRSAVHIEAIVSICKNMNSSVNAALKQGPQVDISDIKMHSDGSPDSGYNNMKEKKFEEEVLHVDEKRSDHVKSRTKLFGIVSTGKCNHKGETHEHKIDASKKVRQQAGVNRFLTERLPCSPQSSGYQKDSDYDSNDARSEPTTERLFPKVLSKRGLDSGACQIEDDCIIESKKQKLDKVNEELVDCAFCHTSGATEAVGPMLHYLDGEQMTDDQALQANVLHVHQRCIEWAPQVYFVGETAMNLEAELARASKIKCSHCGLKGAALGCYTKSCRRSYHVPCANDISGCRWDYEKFLLLCPVHSSNKLPFNLLLILLGVGARCHSSPRMDQTSSMKYPGDAWTREWMLCGSALSREDKDVLEDFVSLTGAAATGLWNSSITHVIAATDEHGACSRTLKVLMAILSGKWVLRVDWLQACMEAGHPVSEEPYEISHDIHGSFDGPRNGRMRAMQKAPKLFAELTFYFNGYFMPTYKKYLENLILAAGGRFLEKSEVVPATFIVYSVEPPQGSDSNDLNEVIRKRKEDAEAFAVKTFSRVVAHTWLLDAIAACNLPRNI
ncbi:BRCA1 C Terminus (BRCT) domain [Musa troglodytarum]|uniref:BRCA1 C Terminus (BRCT) domain n=1 Tax=Musa troglodytarum TaxID=320322 RepID=A0A9E7KUS2_9LILI|nr:BRCA1 C Terminus (BRCT) domain [Musa troglodytarum]